MSDPDTAGSGKDRRPARLLPLDLVRGFLIGSAELVPGVSGGTVALVTGVYEQLIASASHVLAAARALAVGPDRRRATLTELRRTDWRLIVPVLVGMALAVLTIAGVMSSFVTDHPENARGLFFGLVAASIIVPIRMLPEPHRAPALDAGLAVLAAVTAYLLVTLATGGSSTDPPLYVVFLAAAVAVCALVVPGVSGSFLLLAIGIYTVTLDAVSERDLVYIAVFGAGAVCGLASFVQLIGYLLREHRRTTLVVMTGLMVGSLRALWPWQSSSGGGEASGPGALLAPTEPLVGPLLLMALGVAVVLALVWVQARSERRDEHDRAPEAQR
ncbi:MAG TPA: DUF368 domain-containing protein [Ornithinimicrobium sp.]|uniref:DUF368 domain-containing protein n=1 Tax=Ornithinimicrobium sp. TaxID=1977084 RepID=UPI002B47BBCE|nr:DUF368 domain-containing protein [Ornithinimicrobium sp.]HKJ12438.1 DUF368 domain-containing protein [Ornithinimicrobium sp.]